MVQVNVNLSKQDIMAARLIFFIRSGFGRFVMLLALVLALANYMFAQHGSQEDSSFVGAIWIPLIIGWLIVPGAVAVAGINGAAVQRMLTYVEYRFDEAGIHIVTPNLSTRFTWSEVQSAYESRHYLVFTNSGAVQIVPKRCASSDTLVALKGFVSKYLGSRAKRI